MDMCDIMLLSGGVDDDLLEDVLSTILFIEEDTHGNTDGIGHDDNHQGVAPI
jgi:hypothetical protein